jgi:primosomal protein N' (replication factor Y)
MYVIVRLLKGFPKPLIYKLSTTQKQTKITGKIVLVPIKNKTTPALILKTYTKLPYKTNFKIKEIIGEESFPQDTLYHSFLEKISQFYFVEPLHFYQRVAHFLLTAKKNVSENKQLHNIHTNEKKHIKLTTEQSGVLKEIRQSISQTHFCPMLLHGVTGSGKTEIYKRLIIEQITHNKTVILLLPEVSLSVQFHHILQKQLPKEIPIIGFHSTSTLSEKKILWQHLNNNKPILIIGVHLPVLLPVSNLGLIIIDEEHETGFQEKKHPKINSKEIAIWRAKHYKIPILLGSATPSLHSLYNVKQKKWRFFQLKKRFSGSFPSIKRILLCQKKPRKNKSFWISKELEEEIQKNLEKKEQTIIYINRRGFSFFVQCKHCGFIFQCPNCSVSLTLHSYKHGDILQCHYCNFSQMISNNCPTCQTSNEELIKKGIGTQQVVKILQHMFPHAIIERADTDSAKKKREWYKTLEKFENKTIDILVGTQIITKGYHFEHVTLVGILWADLNLHFPLFNASETTLQKLIQVAGRAGRQQKESRVIVQAIHNHDVFNHINEEHYIDFCKKELELRKQTNYPPFGRLIQIELKNTNATQLDKDTHIFAQLLNQKNQELQLQITVLGPARPIVYKVQKMECRHIFLKTHSFAKVHALLKHIDFKTFKSKIYVVPTP